MLNLYTGFWYAKQKCGAALISYNGIIVCHFFKQKWQTRSFSNVRIWSFSVAYMIVNCIFLTFGQLIRQYRDIWRHQHEVIIFYGFFCHFIDKTMNWDFSLPLNILGPTFSLPTQRSPQEKAPDHDRQNPKISQNTQ